MERWRKKVALVTGASAGIGAAICRDLLQHGMIVVGIARNVNKITETLASEPNAQNLLALKCDLQNESEILAVFQEIRDKYKRIDVCINNAAFSTVCPLLSGKTEDWKSMLEVNVLAVCICTREAIKLMQENDVTEGQIIHISSLGGHQVFKAFGFYCGTKFMIRALTEGLRQELREIKSPIRISSISPGVVKTEFAYRMFSHQDTSKVDAFYDTYASLSPSDISAMVINILQSPSHVEINDILIRPTDEMEIETATIIK